MTTTPTPADQHLKDLVSLPACSDVSTEYAKRVLRQAIAERDSARKGRETAYKLTEKAVAAGLKAEAERDQALAHRDKALGYQRDEAERAEKAEARVAVYRYELKLLALEAHRHEHGFICVACCAARVLDGDDQAAEALLAERDGLKALTDELGRANKASFAREAKLKAKLDVAVEALKDQYRYYGCKEAAEAIAAVN